VSKKLVVRLRHVFGKACLCEGIFSRLGIVRRNKRKKPWWAPHELGGTRRDGALKDLLPRKLGAQVFERIAASQVGGARQHLLPRKLGACGNAQRLAASQVGGARQADLLYLLSSRAPLGLPLRSRDGCLSQILFFVSKIFARGGKTTSELN